VIVLTTFGERENVLRALESGGAGFLLKDSAPAELIRAVRAAAAGDAYLSPGATRHVVEQLASGRAPARAERARQLVTALSARERDVLALLGEGLSNADAGKRLHMSEATVKTYVSRILAKLDCENRVQAALLARDAAL
jgi:DNA-binding NarL/FixJ family response regulator